MEVFISFENGKVRCPKTFLIFTFNLDLLCSFLLKKTGLRCADKSARCASWAAAGECKKSGWIFRHCLISCKGKCDSQPVQPAGQFHDNSFVQYRDLW